MKDVLPADIFQKRFGWPRPANGNLVTTADNLKVLAAMTYTVDRQTVSEPKEIRCSRFQISHLYKNTKKRKKQISDIDATRAKIVLIPLEDRAASNKGKDGVFENDPWANWNEPEKNTRSPRPAKSTGTAFAKIDFSFFHANESDVPPIALNQLLQGVPGLFVSNVEEIKPHLAAVSKNKLSVGAAGVLFLGASLSDFNLGSSVTIENCIVPGWIGQHPSVIQAVLLNCGDEPILMKQIGDIGCPSLSFRAPGRPVSCLQRYLC